MGAFGAGDDFKVRTKAVYFVVTVGQLEKIGPND
jgi:hypothetical protein